MNKKIFCTGTMYLDINCTNFPFENSLPSEMESVGSDYELTPGGSALNFARMCAALGLDTIFVGKCGNDLTGDILIDLTQKEKIIPAFIRSSEVKTNLGINYINAEGKTLLTSVGNANQSLTEEEILLKFKEYSKEIQYLYLGGVLKLSALVNALDEILAICRQNKIKIILDHGRITSAITKEKLKLVQDLIPQVDYYLPSIDEFLFVFNANNIEQAIINAKGHIKNLVIKDSSNGAFGFIDGKLINVKSYSVNPKNTIGAGDSFNAGFITALIKEYSYLDSIKFANATAAVKISTDKLPTIEEVTKLYLHSNK